MINKMVLWTVQFGLNYGINNVSGKPEINQIYAILDSAISSWIQLFDTAPLYGNSEEIIWSYLKDRWSFEDVRIISKFPWLWKLDSSNKEDIASEIRKSITYSKNLIWVTSFDWYLLHRANEFYNRDIIESLIGMKNEWVIQNIGVSIYTPEDALNVSLDQNMDYIQIPFNALDQRLKNTDFFENCKKNKIKVFARSIFLQWLLLMEKNKIPPHLKEVSSFLEDFDGIISKSWLTRQEAAMQYVLQNNDIDYLVFGIDNITQLNENIAIAKRKIDFSQEIWEIELRFKNIDERILSPNLW